MYYEKQKLINCFNHYVSRDVHYIERTGEEFYYTMSATPVEIDKKMKLLTYFRRYMTDHLIKAGAAHVPRRECDKLTRVPYMHIWKRSSSAVTMQLTNGTIQVPSTVLFYVTDNLCNPYK